MTMNLYGSDIFTRQKSNDSFLLELRVRINFFFFCHNFSYQSSHNGHKNASG